MTYRETLAYMSKLGRFGMKLGTERTRAILDELGAPDRRLRGVLIAGTNGKGSTGACISAMLTASGQRVGFMPKPHLISYTERIQVDGEPITEAEFVEAFESIRPALDAVAAELGQATEFEMLTAMAIAYLAPRIDQLVCEVGLGGRLDATNALDLGVAVITNVDLDHQKYLGDTVEQIANEKAAIIKPHNTVITGAEGAALAVVEEHARLAGARIWRLGADIHMRSTARGWKGHVLDVSGPGFAHRDLELSLAGDYQPANAALAVAAVHAMVADLPDEAVRRGLSSVVWPGRLQVVAEHPRVVLDGGHNPAAMAKAGTSLRTLIDGERLIAVFGMLSERDPRLLLPALRELHADAVVFTEADSAGSHAVPAADLAAVYGSGSEAVSRVDAALARARELAGREGNVLVCGSLYLVGDVLALSQQTSRRR
jgi:dihydrofolate synthase / folylpolyglutamate synthase